MCIRDRRTAVDGVVYEELSQYFADLNNAALCTRIAEKALTAAKARIAAKKAKKIEREKSKADSAPLVGKLSSCTGRKAEDNELFIVEGDSAGGNAKMAVSYTHLSLSFKMRKYRCRPKWQRLSANFAKKQM